jgi:hypothetical protein
MTKTQTHRRFLAVSLGLVLGAVSLVWAKWEKEQVALENDLSQRIESILSKTLSPNSYLVTVKVEMGDSSGGGIQRNVNTRGGDNPFMQKNRFVLPGVPEKKQFANTSQVTEESTVINTPIEALVKKISITVLVATDVTNEQIKSLRDFIGSSIPFNPLRGDELDIHTSPLLKPSTPSVKTSDPEALAAARQTWSDKFLGGNASSLPLLIVLAFLGLGLIGLAAFLFGPVRGFFNSLVAVLPRVGEQAAYAANNGPSAASAAAPAANPMAPQYPGHSGNPNEDNGPKLNMPFQFIREEQLSKLPLLFRELSSSEVALVLAYLPAAWASRLLSSFDAATQAAVTRELSKGREVSADVVNQVEAQIREKLPYMVGGGDWIQTVFPLTQPQTQRVLLNTLSQESPELAKALRLKTFFFEDIANLSATGLRVLVQDAGYSQIALALKDEKKDLQETIFQRLPAGIRTIVQQELELAGTDKKAIAEAKNRTVTNVRRLLAEGRITLGAA